MTKNELWEIWELAKKGNTYSRKPLPVEYIKEAEEYINGSNSTIEKKKTSWSAVYPMVLLKELGGENESIAKRILFVISQWRREGVISDYYYMFNDIDIAVKIGYSLPEIIEESIIRFKKNLSVDYIEPSLEKLWKYFTDENFAKFADNLFKNNIDTLIEKKNENHMFFTLLITASLLYKKDPVKYERYLKPIMDYAEKFADISTCMILSKIYPISKEAETLLVKLIKENEGARVNIYKFGFHRDFKKLKKFCDDKNIPESYPLLLLILEVMNEYKSDTKKIAQYFTEAYKENREEFMKVYYRLSNKINSIKSLFLLAVMVKNNGEEEELKEEKINADIMRYIEAGFKNKNTNILEYLKGNISKEEVIKKHMKDNIPMIEHFYTAVASMYTHSSIARKFWDIYMAVAGKDTYHSSEIMLYNYFVDGRYKWLDKSPINSAEVLMKYKFPFKRILAIYCIAGDGNWNGENLNMADAVEITRGHEDEALELLDEWRKLEKCSSDETAYQTRLMELLFDKSDVSDYSLLVEMINHKSKVIKKKAEDIITRHKEETEKLLESAKNKAKGETLQIINRIMKFWNNEHLFHDGFSFTNESAIKFCTENFDTANAKVISWLPKDILSGVRFADMSGTAPAVIMEFILVEYMSLAAPYRVKAADKVAEILNMQDIQKTLEGIYNIWLDNGADTKLKMILLPYCVFASDTQILNLNKQLLKWAEASRGALAAFAVSVAALNGGSVALMMVDSISGKFPNNQVKKAAKLAFSAAAKILDLPEDVLSDRIIPSLGFDRAGKKVLDFGAHTFTLSLTPDFVLSIYDNGKAKFVKSLPKPTGEDDPVKAETAKKELSELKKQIKAVVQTQSNRLKKVLMNGRYWNSESWNTLFVENPIMHQFAIGLIWGVYEDNKLTQSFRYMEDGTFNTVDEEEFILPENAQITLVHPAELGEELTSSWKTQLDDYEIVQPIEQLDLPVIELAENDMAGKKIIRYSDKYITAGKMNSSAKKYEFIRGEVLDAGSFFCYHIVDKFLNIYVHINVDDMYMGQDFEEQISIKEVTFCRLPEAGEPLDDIKNNMILDVSSLSLRFVSSVIGLLDKITE